MNHTEPKNKFSLGQLLRQGRAPKAKLGIILVLLIVLIIGAIPAYLSGTWQSSIAVENIDQIREVKQDGLSITDWETDQQGQVQIGGHQWSLQTLIAKQPSQPRPIFLFLLPQEESKQPPYVEWIDMDGFFKWRVAERNSLTFTTTVDGTKATVKANYFLARDQTNSPVAVRQTVAVVQWYAWATGGDGSSITWFWRDQKAQLKGDRIPWIAVALRIPIDPKQDLAEVKDDVTDLAETVQASLMEKVFLENDTD